MFLGIVATISFVVVGSYWVYYYLPSTLSRLGIVFMFLLPMVWGAIVGTRRVGARRDLSILVVLVTVLATPAFVFLIRNEARLSPFLEGVEFSETRMLAEEYARLGRLELSTPHSMFFQTPYVMYAIGTLGGIPIRYTSIVIVFAQVVLMGIVALYAIRVIRSGSTNASPLAELVVFSLLSSRNLMGTNVAYRYLGSIIFLLAVFYLFRWDGRARSKAFPIILLTLLIGSTIGDPISAIAAGLFFGIYALEKRSVSTAIYFVLPIAYMIYSGVSYVYSLKVYSTYAWSGFLEFYDRLFTGAFSERVLPWGRATVYPSEDTYVTGAAYLSLILLAVAVALFHAHRLWICRHSRLPETSLAGLRAVTVSLFCMILLATVTYIGASIKSESTFSDIRSIVFIFVFVYLLFSFNSNALTTTIQRRKAVAITLMGLLIVCSMTAVYDSYPKSLADPIRVVEDERLGLRSIGYAGNHLIAYYSSGNIIRDYKMHYVDLEFVVSKPYSINLIDESRDVSTPYLLAINVDGLRYPSLYISREGYHKAYELAINGNVVYSNGAVLVSTQE